MGAVENLVQIDDRSPASCTAGYGRKLAGLEASDWVAARLDDIGCRLSAVEQTVATRHEIQGMSNLLENAEIGVSVDEVKWLLALLTRRDATVRRVEAVWEQLHAQQHTSMRELKIAAQLRTALSA